MGAPYLRDSHFFSVKQQMFLRFAEFERLERSRLRGSGTGSILSRDSASQVCLGFAGRRSLVCRTGFCCPFVVQIAWFDICFSQCHKPVVLSTGPHCRYTHWKQTVFYMEDVLVADVGDKVEGMIAVKKSRKNPRDLDIKISYSFKPKHASRPIASTQFYRLR